MEQSRLNIDDDDARWSTNNQPTYRSLPIDHQDFWIIENEGINYYIVDLQKYDVNTLMDIIDGCADVEKESWKAQEDFYDYIQKCDGLGYAVLNNRIIGFTAGRAFYHGSICIYCSDETMVLRGFRNRNIGRNLLFSGMRWGLKNRSFEGVKHFGLLAISSNPRIINVFYKYSCLIKILFDCSFNASDRLIEALKAYRNHHHISLVHKDYPFCLKNMFPGSNTFNPEDKKFQFLDVVKLNMPVHFDHMKRGDAFAFLVKVPKYLTRAVVFTLMILSFGKKFFSRKGIGLFTRNTC